MSQEPCYHDIPQKHDGVIMGFCFFRWLLGNPIRVSKDILKCGVIIKPILSSLVAPEAVITTASCATSDTKWALWQRCVFSVAVQPPAKVQRNIDHAGLGLGLRPVNERRRYIVTTSLIGWAQAWNHPCSHFNFQCRRLDNSLDTMIRWMIKHLLRPRRSKLRSSFVTLVNIILMSSWRRS